MNIEQIRNTNELTSTSTFGVGRSIFGVLTVLVLLSLCSCQSTPPSPTIRIALANNNKTLQIRGLDPAIMADINRDDSTSWEVLFPIYKLPADAEMKDIVPQQPGVYLLKDSVLQFTPDTAFIPMQSYFIRYSHFGQGNTLWDYIKGNAKAKRTNYTDLIFKP